jgi:hypothetical protein
LSFKSLINTDKEVGCYGFGYVILKGPFL